MQFRSKAGRVRQFLVLGAWMAVAVTAKRHPLQTVPTITTTTNTNLHHHQHHMPLVETLDNSLTSPPSTTAPHRPASRRYLRYVMTVSSLNVIINTFRPDPDMYWQMRIPRIGWEICIRTVAQMARFQIMVSQEEPETTSASSSSWLLLLSIMLGTTALVDIFVWTPLFASMASFQHCSGGGWFSRAPRVCSTDYSKGVGRLVASMQSQLGGLFYLMAAIITWNDYCEIRQEQKIQRQMQSLAKIS